MIGLRNAVRRGSELRQVVMLGTDFYKGEQFLAGETTQGDATPPLGVGRGLVLERATIDKNVRIGDNVIIRAKPDVRNFKGTFTGHATASPLSPKASSFPPGPSFSRRGSR